MPRTFYMTWEKSQTRWRKMHKGKIYFVSCDNLLLPTACWTKELSYRAANDWWSRKRAELEGIQLDSVSSALLNTLRSINPRTLHETIEKGDMSRLLVQLITSTANGDSMNERVKTLISALEQGKAVSCEALEVEGDKADKLNLLASELGQSFVSADKTLSHYAGLWTKSEQDKVITGKVTQGRVKNNETALRPFLSFMGENASVDTLTEETWLNWTSSVVRMDKANETKRRFIGVSQRFCQFLYDMKAVQDLPRNLKRPVGIVRTAKTITVWTDDEVRTAYASLTGKTRLYFLLAMNCGMQGQDMADLQDGEVDWAGGSITRKRSKTSEHENVPVVRYRLWDETARLLQEFRTEGEKVLACTADSVSASLNTAIRKVLPERSVKELRATASTKLGTHKDYKFYTGYFLGHAPASMRDTNYVKPNDKEFFLALDWLGTALQIA